MSSKKWARKSHARQTRCNWEARLRCRCKTGVVAPTTCQDWDVAGRIDVTCRGVRGASRVPQDSGKQSPVVRISHVLRLGHGEALKDDAPRDTRRVLRLPGTMGDRVPWEPELNGAPQVCGASAKNC
ncbi:hypothetical protein NDU88_008821 [Pleurodeles waltl]|uniref:Uncharacterized protein n=1 Tax=Pleurodeles waltl TaxID=8319 RepID=A0AAV7RTI1_PLEWA|nr:hypothetical protein NDU88_008821 [Pleurodeles waltl]